MHSYYEPWNGGEPDRPAELKAALARVRELETRLAKWEALDHAFTAWQRAGVEGDMRNTILAWAEVDRLRNEATGRGGDGGSLRDD